MENPVKLTQKQLEILEILADKNSFFSSLLNQYNNKGILSRKQFDCLGKELPNNLKEPITVKEEKVIKLQIHIEFENISEFNKLKEFQKTLVKETFNILESNGSALMAWDMGSGKTYGAAFLLKLYSSQGYKFGIICPKPIIKKWYDILTEFNIPIDNCYFISNYESIINGKKVIYRAKKRGNGFMEEKQSIQELENDSFNFQSKTIFIVDEAHKFKNWETKISEFGMRIAEFQKSHLESRVLLLTGTLSESPLKLWVSGVILKKFFNLWQYFEFLADMGCTKNNYGWELTYPKIYKSKIHGFLSNVMTRIKFEEIPNAPKQRIEIQFIEGSIMNNDTKLVIEAAKLKLSQYKTQARSDIVQMLRERQLRELEKLGEIASEIINFTNGTKYVVFLNYSQSIDLLHKHLLTFGKKSAIYDGRNVHERENNRIKFQNQELDCLICNIQAAREGIDLHDTSPDHSHPRISLFSPCYNAQTTAQALGRIHRIDGGFAYQKFLIIENTIEEYVWRNISNKLDNIDNLNDGESVLLKELKLYEEEISDDLNDEQIQRIIETRRDQAIKAGIIEYAQE